MKRFMAMLTTAVMLMSVVLSQAAFAAFSDVNDSNPYKSAITTLSTLSVIDGYEDGTFRPDGEITRSEFTKLIVYMLGLQGLTYPSYSFDDVDPGFWAANFIQTAYDRGIIVGFEDGTFHPQDQVTYAQALKMVVCTLGYEQFAKVRTATGTDWANQYIQEANDLGLTKNISNAPYYDGASRGVVAQVLYNALEIKMYENNGYNWVSTEKTLLNDYLKVKELKGTLIGVDDYITEQCTIAVPEQHIVMLDSNNEQIPIDYSTFTDKVTDLNKYLGNTMTIYYRQVSDNDDRTLINIETESTKNTVIDIDYYNLNGVSDNSLSYYESNSRSKNAKLKTEDLTVRYNGKLVGVNDTVSLNGRSYTRRQALEQWLTPDTANFIYGNVQLTDTGNDGTIDMIQINNYDIYVATAAVSTSDYRLTDKLVTGKYKILDPQSATYSYTVTKNGTEIPVTSIAANDVVLYAESLDDSLKTLLVTNQTVKGNITSMSSDNSRVTISGKTYDITQECINYIKEKNNKDVKVGISGTFYLDAFDTIVFGTIDEVTASPYAYIIDAYLDYDEGGKPYITVYAPSVNASEAASYKLKNTVKLNGSSMDSERAITRIQTAASYVDDESAFALDIYESADLQPINKKYPQPARVTISNKEVTDIVLLNDGTVMPQNEDKEKIVKCKELDGYSFSSNSFKLDNQTAFSVNSSTTVIYVPRDRSQKKQYAKKTVSSTFSSGSDDKYYVEAYDLNASKIAGLVIYYANDGTLTTVKKDSDFSIVASLPESTYSEIKDASVQKFDVYSGTNTKKSWTTANATDFSDIQVGDVIQFAYDSDNLIQKRVNNIRYADIAAVLGGEAYNGQRFNWKQEITTPSENNNWQTEKFDYKFRNARTHDVEMYTSSTLGSVPNSRIAAFNVSQVLLDENKLYVTKGGFDASSPSPVIDDSEYEEITITPSTKFIRMEDDRKDISRYVDETTTDLSINDLRDAKDYGAECSKILVAFSKGNAKLIMILK